LGKDWLEIWQAVAHVKDCYNLSADAATALVCEACSSGKVSWKPPNNPRLPSEWKDAEIDVAGNQLRYAGGTPALPQINSAFIWWLENCWSERGRFQVRSTDSTSNILKHAMDHFGCGEADLREMATVAGYKGEQGFRHYLEQLAEGPAPDDKMGDNSFNLDMSASPPSGNSAYLPKVETSPSNASTKRKTGPKPRIRERVKQAMRVDLKQGVPLQEWPQKSLAHEYSAARVT
jgi:hypothetical protein